MIQMKMKQFLAIFMTFSMLLCGNGDSYAVFASSVSSEQSVVDSDVAGKEKTSEASLNKGVSSKISADTNRNKEDSEETKKINLNEMEPNEETNETEPTQTNIANGTNLPSTVEELKGITKGTLYLISSYEQWCALSEYSKENDLSGFRFQYNPLSVGTNIYNEYDLTQTGFKGLGSEDHPFAGELSSHYEVNTITLKLNQPLFTCLSSKANVENNKIVMIGSDITENSYSAGLAGHLIVAGDGPLKYKDINISGTIGSAGSKGCAGGLFGKVTLAQEYAVTLQGENVFVAADITSQMVGGLIGELKGNAKIDLDGFNFASTKVNGINGNTLSKNEGCIGGLIGFVNGAAQGNNRLTLTTSNGSLFEYQHPDYTCSGNSTYCGGFFGRIKNVDIDVKCPLTYKGNMNFDGITGYNAGAFAGSIEQSTIMLYNQVICNDVRLDRPSAQPDNWESYGIGLFAGSIRDSKICVADSYTPSNSDIQNEPAILIKTDAISDKSSNLTDDEKYPPNCNNQGKIQAYNLGGLFGRAEDTDLEFTAAHPCTLKSTKLGKCAGNVGGAIGYFCSTKDTHIINYIIFDKNNMASLLNQRSGYTGGIVGKVNLADAGNVTISNSKFNGTLRFAASDNNNNKDVSVGILVGGVLSGESSTGAITLNQVSADNFQILTTDQGQLFAFGGAVGKLDADFSIRDCSVFSNGDITFPNSNLRMKTSYFGGIIGVVQNNQTDKTRKGVIYAKDGMVSTPLTNGIVREAYGGLLGSVDENTAISISGKIDAKNQKAYLDNRLDPTFAGSIVGMQNNSLIYMEPDTTITISDNLKNGMDEVGNYGGVIRNKNWNSENDKDNIKLIEDFQVTGTLSTDLNSTEDLLRFAIAMNTNGVFLPSGNQTDSSPLKTFEEISRATYRLSQASYDLRDTGLSCLTRNDDSLTTFFGSFLGSSGQTTIKYSMTNHNHPYSGLFASVGKKEHDSTFENIILEYSIVFAKNTFSNGNLSYQNTYYKYAKKEYAGGLAAEARGNIVLKNVSVTGKISDIINCNWSNTQFIVKENIPKEEDFLGGIFGKYTASDNSSININQLECNSVFTYQDYTHTMGGIIGYVDLDAVVADKPCTINITGTEANPVLLSGSINVENLDDNSIKNGITSPIKVGGLIAQIGKERSDSYAAKCNLNIDHLQVDGLNITETISELCDSEIGGFFGWQWNDVKANLSHITLGKKAEGTGEGNVTTNLSANAPFGGLVHTVNGKMTIDQLCVGYNVSLDAKNDASVDQCGLLVRNGQYLYLDIRGYEFKDKVKLLNYKGSSFDELVGFNRGANEDDTVNLSHGGIVTIGYTDSDMYHLGRNDKAYNSYLGGHIVDAKGIQIANNSHTRYYYDLNKLTSWPELDTGDQAQTINLSTLDSADSVMYWHLLHYVNPYLKSCLNPSYSVDSKLPADYTIGTVNMKGYSIYPTSVSSEKYTGGSITFGAQSIINGESEVSTEPKVKKYPSAANYEHYQMQSGLFEDVSGLNVANLTISGSYSAYIKTSSTKVAGALIAGSVLGVPKSDENGKSIYDDRVKNKFSNIGLSNLWCVSDGTLSFDAPIGLMIADISSGAQVDFDGISMTGYYDDMVTSEKKAASALIGNVGGVDATYISLSFKNMDIADAANDKSSSSLHSSKSDEALARASFIYSYDYSENCNAIYTFTYTDYLNGRCTNSNTGKVTLGYELGNSGESPNYALEEYFDSNLFVGQMVEQDQGIIYNCENYIPYVAIERKKLLINPKVGNLNVGCGTYEDPYVISRTSQLLSLYRYLYNEDNFSESFIQGQWSVNPTGSDDKKCSKLDGDTGHGLPIKYKETNFPTQQQLSRAYYLITDNIDLSNYPEFLGFGTADMPFVGVFVGQDIDPIAVAETSIFSHPTITMPKIEEVNSKPNFGFIQNAKGCVVRNLIISYSQPVPINQTITVTENNTEVAKNEGGTGGGVIATVLGGENLIDNVKVSGTGFTPKNTKAEIGGYVGRVNAGGVILRNLDTTLLSGFKVNIDTGVSSNLDDYLYTCGVIGRVYNGYVVYDGGINVEEPLIKTYMPDLTGSSTLNAADDSGIYQKLMQSRSYDILNGDYLSNELSDNNKITWNSTNGFGNIANAKSIQVMSMALNAGLLNYNANANNYLYDGYNSASRQRSGNYDYVGKVDTSSSDNQSNTERQNVLDNDQKSLHSYLSRFFNDWGLMKETPGNLYQTGSTTTFKLTGTDYNMSVFGTAFRGLGARYFENEYTASSKTRANVFHSNLSGPENGVARITLNMQADDVQNIGDIALLNNVISPNKTPQDICIKNILLTGTVSNLSTDTDQIDASTGIGVKNASALISTLKKVNVTFENVGLESMTVASQRYAGGMVANNSDSCILRFDNCNISGTESSHTHISGFADTGGFVGFTNGFVDINRSNTKIESSLNYLDVENNSNAVETTQNSATILKNVGGLIGTAQAYVSIIGIEGNNVSVKTTGDKRSVQIGGLVGRAEKKNDDNHKEHNFDNIILRNLDVVNIFSGDYVSNNKEETGIIGTGGIVGAIEGTIKMNQITIGSPEPQEQVSIKNISNKVPNHSQYGSGGLVGRMMNYNNTSTGLTATDCHVLGAEKGGTYTTLIDGSGSNVAGITGNCYGFAGTNLSVENVAIEASRYAGGIVSWPESNLCTFTNVSVHNVSIKLSGEYATNMKAADVGGIVSHSCGELALKNVNVDGFKILSENGDKVGGLIGYTQMKVTISLPENNGQSVGNSVKNCVLLGNIVGGVVGYTAKQVKINSVDVSGNEIISYSGGYSGGVVGSLSTGSLTDLYGNNITVSDNIISAYHTSNSKYAWLGGLCGSINSKICFFDVALSDNAIGMMKVNTSNVADDNALPHDAKDRINRLNNNLILSQELKSFLYFAIEYNKKDAKRMEQYVDGSVLSEEKFYNYSYYQGAVFGNASAENISKVINLSIAYQNSLYRPVSDVGVNPTLRMKSNNDMYDYCRSRCVLVYDGKGKENTSTPTIKHKLLTEDATIEDAPYVFDNLESIMNEYMEQTSDRRMVYRLGENYQNSEVIDRGTTENPGVNINKSIVEIYKGTYKNDDKYCSPYGNDIPMIAYKTQDNGTLDEVLQSYINMLTNNSGALNGLIDTNQTTVSVTTYPMKVVDGIVSQNSDSTASVNIGKGDDELYCFTSSKGDDYTDENNGTFTLIRIVYRNTYDRTTFSWTLDLPVYVEKRLKLTSNMKMLEGIRYNKTKLKEVGQHVLDSDTTKSYMILSKGASYSIYAEYIYEDSEKFASVKIPKSIMIETDARVYFTPGTKLTLIPLDEGSKAYYYEMPESASTEMPKEIEFTKFTDIDSQAYVTQEITGKESITEYRDICGKTHEGNSKVERFVILVDTSDAADSGDSSGSSTTKNRLYEMHVKPSSCFKNDQALYARTDYTDHCYGNVNEIDGAAYKINKLKNNETNNNNTYLKSSSSITEDGTVGVHLQYDITADDTYWNSVASSEPIYLDVGFSLAYKGGKDDIMQKVPFPSGTTITLGTGQDKISIPAAGNQVTSYYYQSLRQAGKDGTGSYVKINELKSSISSQIDLTFDFAGANLSELEAYMGGSFYVVAQLVVTGNKDLPAAGEVKDSWEAQVGAELKSDFGFALSVDDLTTLGMNQHLPEESDSGVVTYSASIAFPKDSKDKLDSKYYTMIYQIEEKTSTNTGGKPVYKPYTGDDVSLFLGKFTNADAAKSAATNETNSVNSGNGFVAVSYQFSTEQITAGADLVDGKNVSDDAESKTPCVIKTHCTLVANCAGLNMTNYRVKAYLMVTDSLPSTLSFVNGNAESESESSETAAITEISGEGVSDGCLKKQWLRQDSGWSTVSAEQLKDLKSDYFVFT